jgi:hypothetical protein
MLEELERPEYDPYDTYAIERYEALTLLEMYKDDPDSLMWVLSLAWMRGQHAAEELGLKREDNPYLKKQKETS